MTRSIHHEESVGAFTLRCWTALALAANKTDEVSPYLLNLDDIVAREALEADGAGHRLDWRDGSLQRFQRAGQQMRASAIFGDPYRWTTREPRRAPFDVIAVLGGAPMLRCPPHLASECPGSALVVARAMLDETREWLRNPTTIEAQARESLALQKPLVEEAREQAARVACCALHYALTTDGARFAAEIPELRRAEALCDAAQRAAPRMARRLRAEARHVAASCLESLWTNADAARWGDWRPPPASVLKTKELRSWLLPELFQFDKRWPSRSEALAVLRPIGALAWQAIHNVSSNGTAITTLAARAATARGSLELLELLLGEYARYGAAECAATAQATAEEGIRA